MKQFYRDRKGFFASLLRSGGWYLILGAVALAVICTASMVLSAPAPKEEQVRAPRTSETTPSVRQPTTDKDVSLPSEPGTEAAAPAKEPPKDVKMILPVQGSVGTGFSLTVPVFSETMKDWRVHQGVDYLTEEPADVVAVADGLVENVYVSELMGTTVEIRHADGSLSVYQSLAPDPAVIAGQEVRQGDKIGLTGKSADSEILTGNHLHFAVLKNGVYQDPDLRIGS